MSTKLSFVNSVDAVFSTERVIEPYRSSGKLQYIPARYMYANDPSMEEILYLS